MSNKITLAITAAATVAVAAAVAVAAVAVDVVSVTNPSHGIAGALIASAVAAAWRATK